MAGLDEKILTLYARGSSTRDISAQREERYRVNVSTSLISEVTDAVSEDVKAWQCRPLDEVLPDSLSRRPLRQYQGVRASQQAGRLRRPGGDGGGQQNPARSVDWRGGGGGGQVLAQGAHRPQKPGREGYPDCLLLPYFQNASNSEPSQAYTKI